MADKGGTRVQIEAALSKQTNNAETTTRKSTRSRGLAKLRVIRAKWVTGEKRTVKGGTWTVRGWEGKYVKIDMYVKANAIFTVMEKKQ